MKLSVIIPVYNSEKYLDECLKSVCKFPKVEVILIDDGSTDSSESIYKKYENEIMIIKNSNHGVSFSRNLGIEKCTGDWIMFVDSDDVLIDNYYEILEKYNNINKDIIVFNKNKISFDSKKDLMKNIMGLDKLNYNLAIPTSKIFRKKILNNTRFIQNIINGEDMLFNLKNFSNIDFDRVQFVQESIYKYRVNPLSTTKKFDERLFASDILFYKELNNILVKEFNEQEINFIMKENIINNIFTIALRLSFHNEFKYYKKVLKSLNKDIYSISNCDIKISKKNLVVRLIISKLYFMSFIILKINNKIKNNNIGQEYFVEI